MKIVVPNIVKVSGGGGGGSGTVTSVGLSMPAEFSVAGSPVTAAGSFAVSKANQIANLVFAGPTTGSPAAPTFRALVAEDMAAVVSDTAYGAGWDGSTNVAPSQNAVYEKIERLRNQETWSNGQNASTVASGATEFGSLYGGIIGDATTESGRQSVVVRAGTISDWYFRTFTPQPASGSLVLRTRINGANGNMIITIAAGSAAGTFSDLVNSDTVAAGDLVNYSAQNKASSASAQQLTTSNLFTFS